jgi:hypothetical protein
MVQTKDTAMYSNPHQHSIAGSTLGSSGAIAREASGLEHSLNGLGNHVAELEAAVDQLEQRLYGVLRPCAPMPVGEQKLNAVSPVQSPAVDRVQAERGRLERLICRVNDISGRVD